MAEEKKLTARERAMQLAEKESSGSLSQVSQAKLPDNARAIISSDKVAPINTTIHTASVAAAATGVVSLPIADALVLVPIQLKMLQSIYGIYQMKFSDGLVLNFIRMTIIPYIGKSLVDFIPGGSVVNAAVAASITEAIGWSAAISLEKGEDITADTNKFENLLTDSLKNLLPKKEEK